MNARLTDLEMNPIDCSVMASDGDDNLNDVCHRSGCDGVDTTECYACHERFCSSHIHPIVEVKSDNVVLHLCGDCLINRKRFLG